MVLQVVDTINGFPKMICKGCELSKKCTTDRRFIPDQLASLREEERQLEKRRGCLDQRPIPTDLQKLVQLSWYCCKCAIHRNIQAL